MSSAASSTTHPPSLTNNVQQQIQQHNWSQPSQPSSPMGDQSQHVLQQSSSTNGVDILLEAASNHNQDQPGTSEQV